MTLLVEDLLVVMLLDLERNALAVVDVNDNTTRQNTIRRIIIQYYCLCSVIVDIIFVVRNNLIILCADFF